MRIKQARGQYERDMERDFILLAEDSRPPRWRKFAIAGIAIAVVAILIAVVAILTPAPETEKTAQQEFLARQRAGSNGDYAQYRSAYTDYEALDCRITAKYKNSKLSHNIRVVANEGWTRFSVFGILRNGERYNYLRDGNYLYFWADDDEYTNDTQEQATGYWYEVGTPSYYSFLRTLSFSSIDTENSVFDCRYGDYTRDGLLGLPNLKWEEYNVFNAN